MSVPVDSVFAVPSEIPDQENTAAILAKVTGADPQDLLAKLKAGHNFAWVARKVDGGLTFADGISAPGRYVEMHADMDVICLISNCPQLNNPCNGYNPTPVRLLIWDESK